MKKHGTSLPIAFGVARFEGNGFLVFTDDASALPTAASVRFPAVGCQGTTARWNVERAPVAQGCAQGSLHTPRQSDCPTACPHRPKEVPMTISVAVRADNAIVIYDEDDPRFGVVLEKTTDVARLIAALNRSTTQLHGEKAWRWAQMRELMRDDDDEDWILN